MTKKGLTCLTLVSGAITAWDITGEWKPGPGPDHAFASTSTSGDVVSEGDALSSVYGSNSSPGIWTSPAPTTPLPAAFPLFATGLGGLLGWRRKRKSRGSI